MKVYPTIELLDGKAVRLRGTRPEDATVYSDDPMSLIGAFVKAGARRIHVVDLDGAFSGTDVNRQLIAEIVQASSVPIQVGGGIRDRDILEAVFAQGVTFAVLGSSAVENKRFVRKACRDYPDRIIVAVDATGEDVAIDGSDNRSSMKPLELAARAAVWGACALLYTDILKEGGTDGPNVQATAALANSIDIPIIAAGGVSSLDDIRDLAIADIDSVVVDHSLGDHSFTLEQAIAAAEDPGAGEPRAP